MKKRKPPTTAGKDFSNQPLKGLSQLKARLKKEEADKKQARKKELARAEKAKKQAVPEDDEALFAQAMSQITPLAGQKQRKAPLPNIKITAERESEAEEVMNALRELVDGEAPLNIYETGEAIEGMREDLDPRLMHKLRRGEYAVQGHLDLHGHTRLEAKELVERFLLQAIAQGKRCVLIIHGRGHRSKDHVPVLKNAIKSWFVRGAISKKVLAFTSARPCDGSAGAVYVLLRKLRRP